LAHVEGGRARLEAGDGRPAGGAEGKLSPATQFTPVSPANQAMIPFGKESALPLRFHEEQSPGVVEAGDYRAYAAFELEADPIAANRVEPIAEFSLDPARVGWALEVHSTERLIMAARKVAEGMEAARREAPEVGIDPESLQKAASYLESRRAGEAPLALPSQKDNPYVLAAGVAGDGALSGFRLRFPGDENDTGRPGEASFGLKAPPPWSYTAPHGLVTPSNLRTPVELQDLKTEPPPPDLGRRIGDLTPGPPDLSAGVEAIRDIAQLNLTTRYVYFDSHLASQRLLTARNAPLAPLSPRLALLPAAPLEVGGEAGRQTAPTAASEAPAAISPPPSTPGVSPEAAVSAGPPADADAMAWTGPSAGGGPPADQAFTFIDRPSTSGPSVRGQATHDPEKEVAFPPYLLKIKENEIIQNKTPLNLYYLDRSQSWTIPSYIKREPFSEPLALDKQVYQPGFPPEMIVATIKTGIPYDHRDNFLRLTEYPTPPPTHQETAQWRVEKMHNVDKEPENERTQKITENQLYGRDNPTIQEVIRIKERRELDKFEHRVTYLEGTHTPPVDKGRQDTMPEAPPIMDLEGLVWGWNVSR
jgi:lipoprotein-anchoring transpeptidase ErfK/SrfK